jgi:histidinol-phosphate phosphatase family protein
LKSYNKLKIDRSWTLFLDRDGVINTRLVDEYVVNWEQFEFIPNVLEALKRLSGLFYKIVIVSNQQGIGKGLMSEDELLNIHRKMLDEIKANGGQVDNIYFCPFKAEEKSFLRKPDIGMALLARKDFPEINFKKSIIVGDSISDMEFGDRLKMVKVYISEDINTIRKNFKLIDFAYNDLYAFSNDLI